MVTACGDAGGAAALAPLLRRLITDKHVQVESYAYRQGIDVLRRHEIGASVIPDTASDDWFYDRVRNASALVVATSSNGLDHEKLFVAAARRAGVPSMVVLDAWHNHRVRFSDAAGNLSFVPDRIAAMDERVQRDLIAEGIPASAIVITGHAAFDDIRAQRDRFDARAREATRQADGVSPNAVEILFVAQPIAQMFGAGAGAPGFLGFDEVTVLTALIAALEQVAGALAEQITLVVRPHPRENPADYARFKSDRIRVIVSNAPNGREAAMAADVVIGMNSILLVEACLLGCAVVSIQPNVLGANALPEEVERSIQMVRRTEDIIPIVGRLVSDESARRELRARACVGETTQSATARITESVYSLVGSRPPVPPSREVLQ